MAGITSVLGRALLKGKTHDQQGQHLAGDRRSDGTFVLRAVVRVVPLGHGAVVVLKTAAGLRRVPDRRSVGALLVCGLGAVGDIDAETESIVDHPPRGRDLEHAGVVKGADFRVC